MATYAQLRKQIELLSKKADAARQLEKGATLTRVREAVATFELTAEEVFGTAAPTAKKKASKPAAPKRTQKGAGQAKYRDPKSGAVWTGFGRAPAWLASAKDRTKFMIAQPETAKVKPAEKAVVKSAKKATAKKASSAARARPVVKTNANSAIVATKVAKPAKKAAPAAPKASAKAPARNSAKAAAVVKPKIASKPSPMPAVDVDATTPVLEAATPVADAV